MSQLERYVIGEQIGQGQHGIVLLAHDAELDRDVALRKLAVPGGLDEDATAAYLERFEAEVKRAGSIEHANVVRVYDSFVEDGSAYIVMERVSGNTLDVLLDAGPLGYAAALGVTTQVLEALAAAGEKGVVHHDLKPRNVFLLADGTVKVSDFGEAAEQAQASAAIPTPPTGASVDAYRSPEAIRGADVDARSNLFTVGVMLYQMLVGENPFSAPMPAAMMYRIAYEEPSNPAIFVPELPEYVSAILTKALAKDPALRYATAAEMAADINGKVAPDLSAITAAIDARTATATTVAAAAKPPKVRKPFPTKLVAIIAAAAVLVLALGGGGYAIYRSRQLQDTERMTAVRTEGAAMVKHVAEIKALQRDFGQLIATLDSKGAANEQQLAAWDADWQNRTQSYEARSAEVSRHNASEQQKYEASEYTEWYYSYYSGYTYYTYYSYTPNMWESPAYPSKPSPISADFSAEGATLNGLVARVAALKSALVAESTKAAYFGVVYARMIEAADVLATSLNDTSLVMADMVQQNPEKGYVINRSKLALVDATAVTNAVNLVDQEVSLYTSNFSVTIDELLAYETSATPEPAVVPAADAATAPAVDPAAAPVVPASN